MRVDGVFFASKAILENLKAENYASLRQLGNVAALPGIVEPALSMPDIHWGYGFPIGGVAAFDSEDGGVVSPGGIGFDINCGVRLLVSDLNREEVDPSEGRLAEDPRKVRLADTLFGEIPSGVGKSRENFRLDRKELGEVLEEGRLRWSRRATESRRTSSTQSQKVGFRARTPRPSPRGRTGGGSTSLAPSGPATISSRCSTWTRSTTRRSHGLSASKKAS